MFRLGRFKIHRATLDNDEIEMDIIGQILWYAMFATPVLTIPLAWRLFPVKKIYRLIIGLLLAFILSFFLFHISLAICFRDGMGPG